MAHRVALRCTPAALPLRALTGFDEQAVADVSSESAVELLARLIDDPAPPAADLPAADRDLLLAAVHRAAFGDRIEATVTCAGCSAPFDLAFSLSALERSLPESRPGEVRHAGGVLEAPGIGRFRLPTGADELAVCGEEDDAAAAALLERCLVEPAREFEREAFEALLDRIAPLVDADLDATCPECGVQKTLRFDIQSYLLGTLLVERDRLLADIHRLAGAYGWTHAEILALPRDERRALVSLVEAEAAR